MRRPIRQNSNVSPLLTIAVARWCADSISARISPSSACGKAEDGAVLFRIIELLITAFAQEFRNRNRTREPDDLLRLWSTSRLWRQWSLIDHGFTAFTTR